MPLIGAYMRRLPALTAEESLRAVTRLLVGTARLKRHAARSQMRNWERRASEDAPRSLVRPRNAREYRQQLAMVGIGVKFEKPAAPDG